MVKEFNELVKQLLPTNIFYIHFRQNNGLYIHATAIYIGKIKVASLHYDSTQSKSATDKLYYKLTCSIDSLAIHASRHATEKDAAVAAIKIAEKFITQLLYTENK